MLSQLSSGLGSGSSVKSRLKGKPDCLTSSQSNKRSVGVRLQLTYQTVCCVLPGLSVFCLVYKLSTSWSRSNLLWSLERKMFFMFLMFKCTLVFNQMGPTVPLTSGTHPMESASQVMGECWEDLHLTCHSLETTATCTHTTAWWERRVSLFCGFSQVQLPFYLFMCKLTVTFEALITYTVFTMHFVFRHFLFSFVK